MDIITRPWCHYVRLFCFTRSLRDTTCIIFLLCSQGRDLCDLWILVFLLSSKKKLPVNTLFMESLFRAMGTTLCQEMLRKLNSWEIKYSEFMDAIIAQTLACTFRRRQQHTEKKRCGDDNKKLIKASPSVSTPQDKHNPWEKQISVLSCVCCWKVCD